MLTTMSINQLTIALDLSTVTVKRNTDLETRVAELELELSVWKQAHASVVESAERDKKAHNVQVSTLNRQISSLDTIKVRRPAIIATARCEGSPDSSCVTESKPADLMCYRRRRQYLQPFPPCSGSIWWTTSRAAAHEGHCRIFVTRRRSSLRPSLLLDYSIS